MTDAAPTLGVLAERQFGFEPAEVGRLRRLGYQFTLLSPKASLSDKQAALKPIDAMIAVRPSSPDARLWLQAAAGMGVQVLALMARGAPTSAPPLGVKVFTQLELLLTELAGMGAGGVLGHFVSPTLVRSFNPCQESIDYFEHRYPQGGHSRDWTRDEQVSTLKEGGAPWVRSMFDRGVVRQWPMSGVDFSGANLEGLRLADAELRGANFTGARLVGCQLRKTDLVGARLGGAAMANAVLHDCDATDAVLAEVDLSSAHLRNVILDGAELINAKLTDSHIRLGPARRARLAGAQLTGAVIKGCDLSGADLRSAAMAGARFIDCRLIGATLGGDGLAGAAFLDCELGDDQIATVEAADGYVGRLPKGPARASG